VTVCIAAICTWCGDDIEEEIRWLSEPTQVIIGISDRMVSIPGFAQYELSQPKFFNIVNSVMALLAGDNEVTAKIFEQTHSYISKDFKEVPRIISVERIANYYGQNVIAYLTKRRDTIAHSRTGLSYKEFMNLTNWDKKEREEIMLKIKDEPDTSAIITGIDETGAHIFLIDRHGYVSSQDSIGFAVIGSGYYHAASQLMRTRHSPKTPYIDTLLLLYMAKKYAEIDEYVGKDTDIFVIADDRNYNILSEETVKMLEDTYNEIYNKTLAEAKIRIEDYLIKNRNVPNLLT
jgi:hypothetical protein